MLVKPDEEITKLWVLVLREILTIFIIDEPHSFPLGGRNASFLTFDRDTEFTSLINIPRGLEFL